MKWVADIDKPKNMHLEIVLDSVAGYYLYVWENGKDTHDYLHDTLEMTKEIALEWFGVPLDAWQKVDDE